MQPVHDQDDRTLLRVVQPAVEGVVVPLVRRPPLGLRQGLLGLQRIVDDDDVGTPSGQHAADRSGEPAALLGRLEFRHGLPLRGEPRREGPLVPVAHNDTPAIARELVGEILRIADAEDLRAGPTPEAPRRKRDRAQQRLQVARRHIDDQPPDLALVHRSELGRHHLDVPVHRERHERVELAETALREGGEIEPQLRVLLAPGQRLAVNCSGYGHDTGSRGGYWRRHSRERGYEGIVEMNPAPLTLSFLRKQESRDFSRLPWAPAFAGATTWRAGGIFSQPFSRG